MKAILYRLLFIFFGRVPSEQEREEWQKVRLKIKSFPFFYSLSVRILQILSRIDSSPLSYWIARLQHKPYFGGYLKARQSQRLKIQGVLDALEARLKKGENVQMLEIGSYAGQSAVMFASLMKQYGKGHLTIVMH